MANNKEIVKLMLDYRHGNVQKYSNDEAREAIRAALIEANGGSTKLSLKNCRKNTALFDVMSEYIDVYVSEGLSQNDWFNTLCESRNLAEGDSQEFVVKANSNLVVSDVARGVQAVRRQRIGERTTVNIKPTPHIIKCYEEMTRVLAGRADINDLTDNIGKSMTRAMLEDIYGAWDKLTADDLGANYYPVAGTYSEEALMNLINHVEAENDGSQIMLVCTKAGARKIGATAMIGDEVKSDYYNYGYLQKWNGINVMCLPQHHKIGTDTFTFNDNKIYVIPVDTMDKPIKQVVGGESIMTMSEFTDNQDLTQEIVLITQWGTGVVTGTKFGVYELS